MRYVAAPKENGFDGSAIVDIDRVVDPRSTPKFCAAANRDDITKLIPV